MRLKKNWCDKKQKQYRTRLMMAAYVEEADRTIFKVDLLVYVV